MSFKKIASSNFSSTFKIAQIYTTHTNINHVQESQLIAEVGVSNVVFLMTWIVKGGMHGIFLPQKWNSSILRFTQSYIWNVSVQLLFPVTTS